MPTEQESAGKPSRGFVLGLLRAALRPSRIDLAEVKKVLRLASMSGYNPVELYQEAVSERPEEYDPPPLLSALLPRDLPREKQLHLQLGEVLARKKTRSQKPSPESPPSKPSS